MSNKIEKYPVDILIEKLDEINIKLGLPKAKPGNKKGAMVFFPSKDSPLANHLKNKREK